MFEFWEGGVAFGIELESSQDLGLVLKETGRGACFFFFLFFSLFFIPLV